MRVYGIQDDIEVVILQLVRAIPDVFLDFDLNSIQLVEQEDACGAVRLWDIVSVESDETEVVLGEVELGSDLFVHIDIFSGEDELLLTSDDEI